MSRLQFGQEKKDALVFDYVLFEEDLFITVKEYMMRYLPRKDDVYSFSINYHPAFTTLIGMVGNTYTHLDSKGGPTHKWYLEYKFGEEEWEFGEWFDPISLPLQEYYDQWERQYPSYHDGIEKYDEHERIYQEHTQRIIAICMSVLKKIKSTDIYKKFPHLLLNVYVREYFSEDEIIAIYEELNKDVHEAECAELTKWLKG